MIMIRSTIRTLTEAIIANKKEAFSVNFYIGYNAANKIIGDQWHVEILQMGHRNIVNVIRTQGDNVFAFDITCHDNHEKLCAALTAFEFGIYTLAEDQEIWIDTNSTIAVTINGPKTFPAQTADKCARAMELLLFISDEFDRGRCEHTEIEERLNAFF